MPIKNRDNRPSSVKRALAVSDRVFIRKATSRDRKEFLQRMLDSRKLHRSWVPTISTPEGFAEFLRRGRKANREQTLLCRIEDGAIMGVINLNEIIRGLTNSTFIGYYGFQLWKEREVISASAYGDQLLRSLELHDLEAQPAGSLRESRVAPFHSRSVYCVEPHGA